MGPAAPAHYNLLMGLLPHPATRRRWSADVYRDEYRRYADRLDPSTPLARGFDRYGLRERHNDLAFAGCPTTTARRPGSSPARS